MKATMTVEEQIEYLLICIYHSPGFGPNFRAVADDAAVNTPGNAQRRFKTILERGGRFRLEGRNIIDNTAPITDPTTDLPPLTKAKKGKGKGKQAATKAKKRKHDEIEDDDAEMDMGNTKKDNEDDDEGDENDEGGVGSEVVA